MSAREIAALSFSRFARLRRCLLSGAGPSELRGAGIPRPPAGRPQAVGEILHQLMQTLNEGAAGGVTDGPGFRAEFNRVVAEKRAQIAGSPAAAHLGDPGMWPEVTRVYRGLSEAYGRRWQSGAGGGSRTYAEKELRTKDGLLFGRLDAYVVHADGIEVVDYKSGMISEGDAPKEAYVEQLYFYAYLVEENYDRYPRTLSLAGGDGGLLNVRPDPQRSRQIAHEMRAMLAQYNSLVVAATTSEQLASPSTENCSFCDMKPACKAFWSALPVIELSGWHHVAIGRQLTPLVRTQLGGGSFVVTVEQSSLRSDTLKVSRVFERRYPDVDLQTNVGQRLVLTGLRQPSERNLALAEATERSSIVAIPDTQ
jgi:RecB family exonuclease